MLNYKYLGLSLFTLGLALCAAPAFADGQEDYYHQFNQQRFFNYPQTARTLGMGGSSSVTHSGAYSTMGNPAGLGMMKDAEVAMGYGYSQLTGKDSADYGDIEQESHSGYAMGAFPIMPYSDALPAWGNIGLGWSGDRSDTDDVANTDTDGARLHFAYSKAVNDNFSLGYAISVGKDKVDSDTRNYEMDNAIRHNVGAMWKASEATDFGMNVFYGDGDDDLERDLSVDRDSWGIEAGIAHDISDATTLAFSTDYVTYNSDPGIDTNGWGIKTGVEHMFNESLTGRAGYRYQANTDGGFGDSDSDTAKYNAVSLGIGTALGMVNLDYGAEYRATGEGDWSHLVSATVPFSICKE